MDAKSLAQKLGISSKTVHTRARALGITGTQAKTEGSNGRPSLIYSSEECDRIANYGTNQNPVSDGTLDDNTAIDSAAMALRNAIASPLAQQFAAISSQLESIEDQGAEALAMRVSAMPNRMLAKAAQRLAGCETLNIAEVFGVLTPPALPSRCIDVNLGAPLNRQDTLQVFS